MDCTFNTNQNKTERKMKNTAPSLLLEKTWEEDVCLNPGLCSVIVPSTRIVLVEIKRSR